MGQALATEAIAERIRSGGVHAGTRHGRTTTGGAELAERAERLGFDSVFEVSWSRINLNAFLAAGGQALSESRRQAAMSLRAQPVAR